MKKTLVALLTVLSVNSFALTQVSAELMENLEMVQSDEVSEVCVTKISEVRELISTMNPDATCMDEYFQRRNQLIKKIALSPLTLMATTAVSTLGGGVTGGILGLVLVVPTGGAYVEPLQFFVVGATTGFIGASVGTMTDTNIGIFQLIDIDTIIKTLAEQYRNQSGKKSDKLYARFIKKEENPVSKDEFFSKLIEMDMNGKLCDGSLVKQPKFKFGSKLKYKLARTKHLRKAI